MSGQSTYKARHAGGRKRRDRSLRLPLFAVSLFVLVAAGCRSEEKKKTVTPNSLAAVPAARLAYGFAADAEAPPGAVPQEETRLKPVQDDFDSRRKDDRLLRTIVSPDGQRALAVFDTGETQEGEFRIDMYSADGRFLRNLTPPELSGAFAPMVAWSSDGSQIAFIGRKTLAQETPPDMLPDAAPETLPSPPSPLGGVQVFDTEQIYVCDRDGFGLRPLTTRNGLIYFYLAWAPDGHALAALACREDEWDARSRENRQPAGRPRLVETDGRERLLDDRLMEAGPVWSPDSSKVASAFEAEVRIYDAAAETPTQAVLPLRDALLKASAEYDEKNLKGQKGSDGTPVSFNPIVRLYWPEDRTLYAQTAYVRIYASEPVVTFQRWHKLALSIQATPLSRFDYGEEAAGEAARRACAIVWPRQNS
ncbi:MAG TPA: hypothetical protein VN256_08375 [Pyrinomonadaceae bacterium]|nr:hypothetical protein [Pyrinomonadaceae bacterium]